MPLFGFHSSPVNLCREECYGLPKYSVSPLTCHLLDLCETLKVIAAFPSPLLSFCLQSTESMASYRFQLRTVFYMSTKFYSANEFEMLTKVRCCVWDAHTTLVRTVETSCLCYRFGRSHTKESESEAPDHTGLLSYARKAFLVREGLPGQLEDLNPPSTSGPCSRWLFHHLNK